MVVESKNKHREYKC